MTKHLPEPFRRDLHNRAMKGNALKLHNLLEVRVVVEDAKAEKFPPLMELYSEIAEELMCHPDALRADLATIRNYSPDCLAYWLKNKVSFDHIRTANELAEIAKTTPKDLLDKCIELGDENGNTMTVKQLEAFALGGVKRDPIFFRIGALFSRLEKFPVLLGWDAEKSAEFNQSVQEIRTRFFS